MFAMTVLFIDAVVLVDIEFGVLGAFSVMGAIDDAMVVSGTEASGAAWSSGADLCECTGE